MRFDADDIGSEKDGPDLLLLKELLVERGVTVHSNMHGPTESYEMFSNSNGYINGIGTKEIVTAQNEGAVYEGTSMDEIANFISSKYEHFAFYRAEPIKFKEMLTDQEVQAYILRFAGWN